MLKARRLTCFVILILILSFSCITLAEPMQSDVNATGTPLPGIPPTQPVMPVMPGELNVVAGENGKISIEASNRLVTEILEQISKQMRKSVVINGDLKAIVSVRLQEVPLSQALDLLAKTVNFNWREENGIILVSTTEQMGNTKLFPVKYADLNDVKAGLAVLGLGDRITINANPRGILVNASHDKLMQIDQIVQKLDKPVPIIDIEAKMIEVTHDNTLTLGVEWSSPLEVNGAFNVIKDGVTSRGVLQTGEQIRFGTLGADVNFNKVRNSGKLLARPNISTLNNVEAHISTGDEIPIFSRAGTGDNATAMVEYKHVGIDLYTTPQVIDMENDMLTIKVKAIVSMISKLSKDQGLSAPQISTREAQTTINVKSGQMIVIGGLTKEEQTKSRNSIPFLGDLPLIGRLFGSTTDRTATTEVFIFITPRLVKPGM